MATIQHQKTRTFYFSDPMLLRKYITAWDPESNRNGTISNFAERLSNTDDSQAWADFGKDHVLKEKPRRTEHRNDTCTKRTLERALRGDNIAKLSATIIVSELGANFEELKVIGSHPILEPHFPDPEKIEYVMELAMQSAYWWLIQGHKPRPSSDPNTQGLPAHPELIYRVSGEWKGWNDFLGTAPNIPEFDLHKRYDALEDGLFRLVDMVLHHSRERYEKS